MKKTTKHLKQITLIVLISSFLVSQHKTMAFTATKFMDRATQSNVDNFVFADYSKDFVFGMTSFGKVTYRSHISNSLEPSQFETLNLNPLYSASCWKETNECVFAGYKQIEYWTFENAGQQMQAKFAYGMTDMVNANKFRVVKVILGTSYFVAGDFANIGLTRWKKSEAGNFVWYKTAGSNQGECQDIIVIPQTHLSLSIFDNEGKIHIVDFTTMESPGTMTAGTQFNRGGKLAHISRYPTSFLVAGLQNEDNGNTHMLLYNYVDRNIQRTIPAQTSFSASYIVHSLAYVPDSDYLLYTLESGGNGIIGLWRIDKNQAITGYQEQSSGVISKSALWLPQKNQFLVVRSNQIDLVTSDACSSDCKDADPTFNTHCSAGLLIGSCTTCHDDSSPPCSPQAGQVGAIASPLDPSAATFSGESVSIADKGNANPTGIFLADNNLLPIRDQENKAAQIIGIVIAALFLLIILLLWAFFCLKRLARKKVESQAYQREAKRQTKPIWDDEELNQPDGNNAGENISVSRTDDNEGQNLLGGQNDPNALIDGTHKPVMKDNKMKDN